MIQTLKLDRHVSPQVRPAPTRVRNRFTTARFVISGM
jgi:hypothetical protein